MKGPNVYRGLAEEAHAQLVPAPILDGEADAGGDWDVSANDSVPTEEIRLGVEDMHGAALATRASGVAAEQLRHDGARTHSASERLSVIAVRGDDVVVGANH